MSVHIVVPARYASTRLPGKPLVDIAGTPMLVHVMRRAQQAQQTKPAAVVSVVAAVDHPQVLQVLEDAGLDAMMTRGDHTSGSDRVMEVAQRCGWLDDDIVINVQGDEPLLPPVVIEILIDAMNGGTLARPVRMATVCEPIRDTKDFFNPNVVKVVRDRYGDALYFSRAPVPFPRDGTTKDMTGALIDEVPMFRHIGIYAFRVDALREFTQIRGGVLEGVEMLEQLRWLEAGQKLRVVESPVAVPGGVDTPEDLIRVAATLG